MNKAFDLNVFRTTLDLEGMSLFVTEGPHQGFSLRLEQDIIHIGRGDWCDISLSRDMRLSRHHCELRCRADGVWVLDRDSRNGVFVNDVRIAEAHLRPGHRLQLGDTVIELRREHTPTQLRVFFHDRSGSLVGKSEKMRKVFSMLSRLGRTDIPVLFLGETGTGKTSVARALHEQSQDRKGPFVHVNCGALSPALIEGELFGYEKGAFTGADRQHRGYFEQAHGGTLFLDEIGELPLELQPKLLDVLERRQLRRLGAEQESVTDFRLLCATHRDLKAAMREGRFRQDLYYRLAVVELKVPSLRDRLEDLPLLVQSLLSRLASKRNVIVTAEALHKMKRHLWPGNVRELYNVLQRSLVFVQDDVLDAEHLPTFSSSSQEELATEVCREFAKEEATSANPVPMQDPAAYGILPMLDHEGHALDGLQERLMYVERRTVLDILEQVRWNRSKAAELLGVSRSWLYKLLKRHDLES